MSTPESVSIKVFGPTSPCARCQEIEKRVQNVTARFSGRVEVTRFDALSAEGDKYAAMSTPTVVINDRVITFGNCSPEDEMERIIKEELEAV